MFLHTHRDTHSFVLKTQTTNITTTAAAAATNGNEKPKNTKNKNIYETETKKIEKKKN